MNEPVKTYFFLKRNREIFELSVMYGLLSIFNDNDIPCKLINKKSAWIIEVYEEFNPEELLVVPSQSDVDIDYAPVTKMTSKRDYETLVSMAFGEEGDGLSGYFSQNEHILEMLRYFETGNEKYLEVKKHGMKNETFFGTVYGVKGLRGTSPRGSNNKVCLPLKCLSYLGFTRASSVITISDKLELSWLPVPSEKGVKEVVRLSLFQYVDKETGEMKSLKQLREDSLGMGQAKIMLTLQKKLMQGDNLHEFKGVLYIKTVPAGHRSLNDKDELYEFLPFGMETINVFLSVLSSRQSFALRRVFGDFVVYRNLDTFRDFIHTLSKEPNWEISQTVAKELSTMYNQYEILKNPGVEAFGRTLSSLLYYKKGYKAQVDLMGVTTPQELTTALSSMNVMYHRSNQSYKATTVEDLMNVMELVQDDSAMARNVRDMILLRATSFVPKKNNDENTEVETEEHDDEPVLVGV